MLTIFSFFFGHNICKMDLLTNEEKDKLLLEQQQLIQELKRKAAADQDALEVLRRTNLRVQFYFLLDSGQLDTWDHLLDDIDSANFSSSPSSCSSSSSSASISTKKVCTAQYVVRKKSNRSSVRSGEIIMSQFDISMVSKTRDAMTTRELFILF